MSIRSLTSFQYSDTSAELLAISLLEAQAERSVAAHHAFQCATAFEETQRLLDPKDVHAPGLLGVSLREVEDIGEQIAVTGRIPTRSLLNELELANTCVCHKVMIAP